MKEIFRTHVETIVAGARKALADSGYGALLLHAGTPRLYHADDQDIPFRGLPNFRRFVPLDGPHHILLIPLNEKPRLFEVVPEDYWLEQGEESPLLENVIPTKSVKTPAEAWDGAFTKSAVFMGDEDAGNRAREK